MLWIKYLIQQYKVKVRGRGGAGQTLLPERKELPTPAASRAGSSVVSLSPTTLTDWQKEKQRSEDWSGLLLTPCVNVPRVGGGGALASLLSTDCARRHTPTLSASRPQDCLFFCPSLIKDSSSQWNCFPQSYKISEVNVTHCVDFYIVRPRILPWGQKVSLCEAVMDAADVLFMLR